MSWNLLVLSQLSMEEPSMSSIIYYSLLNLEKEFDCKIFDFSQSNSLVTVDRREAKIEKTFFSNIVLIFFLCEVRDRKKEHCKDRSIRVTLITLYDLGERISSVWSKF